jgi:hypothetical protein
MSFLDSIVSAGRSVAGFLGSSGIASTLARTALLGYTLNKINKSINRDNNQNNVDKGVRLQVDPNPETKIPVIYGTTFLGGIVTDAALTNSNRTMFFCLTLSEKTGAKLSDSQNSTFTFKDIYWNDERIVFKSDGITVDYTVDRNGTVNRDYSDLIKVYCYNGSSTSPVTPQGYTNASLPNANSVFPNWTANHTMSDLIFAIVRIDYNKDKNVTGLPKMDFQISNSMTLPGDCLYDYMTNTRYGAGIPPAEIYSS